MAANTFDAEIRKFLPLLDNEEKKSLLTFIKNFLHIQEPDKTPQNTKPSKIDYTKYHFPVSAIKFNRDEINER
jgi:hypothetical protein